MLNNTTKIDSMSVSKTKLTLKVIRQREEEERTAKQEKLEKKLQLAEKKRQREMLKTMNKVLDLRD